ncbi:class I SAM-dependent methyltransferase [Paenibacillus sp. DXFW5]|uniref:Class I SAM-dependent methyltransferase n=1 Tax=Paenibacillus rhizolycopersici TaxID=2780073 RepID=A0ABS2H8Z7_9BACL|nr:TylF/MycF/NovP-related O-methyltransferase [Paenibacillus rhizolycopersici]MBM6997261.1 class I SAM-dependent methyltransferase [Paenibacillus rhizolycopersici]
MLLVFGAGDGGKRILQWHRFLAIDFVIDNNPDKWETDFYGYLIKPPQILSKMDKKNLRIIVASSFYSEIKEQLISFQLVEGIHFWDGIKELEDLASENTKRLLNLHSFDIKRELQRRALEQTVDFVEKYLVKTNSFENKFDLLEFALNHCKSNGLFMEFGVYKGATINFISSKVDKTVYGFDSFEGLPEYWRDGYSAAHFKVEEVPVVNNNVELVKGWFNQTLPQFIGFHSGNCSFIHIDCDLYSSTKDIIDVLKERITKETVIVFDEFFNYPGWRNGEYKAFMEYVNENNISFRYIGYTSNSQQVAIQIL